MKKMKVFFSTLFTALLLVVISFSVQAATVDPLKNFPQNTKTIVCSSAGMGCDYCTPSLTTKFTMSATSSNKKVATVKVYDFSRDGKYSKGFMLTQKGYGTTKITVTVKIGKKTYKKSYTQSYYKYKCPLTSLKIGNKECVSPLKKAVFKKAEDPDTWGGFFEYMNPNLGNYTGKLTYKLQKGFVIKEIGIRNTSNYTLKKIKNNQTIPKGYCLSYIRYQDTKTKAVGYIYNSYR